MNKKPVVILAGLTFLLTACGDDSPQTRESASRQAGYDKLAANQPAATMDYSPTRATVNKWIETWDDPNKLSYVYLQNADGDYGYFILKGLPVSMGVMLTPNYEFREAPHEMDDHVVPAPGVDGAYYNEGADSSYYGIDATTGAFVQFSVGGNQNFFLYDQPMDMPEFKGATPMGPTSMEDVDE